MREKERRNGERTIRKVGKEGKRRKECGGMREKETEGGREGRKVKGGMRERKEDE